MILEPLDQRTINWDFSRFESRDCPFCGAIGAEPSYIRPDKCSVLSCSTCGCYYVSPAPSEGLLNDFYSSYHIAHFGGRIGGGVENIKSELDVLDPLSDPRLSFLVKDMPSKSGAEYRVLDFGCGLGEFLYQAKRLGASVAGVEFDHAAVSICHQLGLESVSLGGIDVLKTIDEKFDLIVLNDVIEHLLNPNQFISALCELLDNGGKILIWTPNGDAIANDDRKIALRVDLEHMQYLTSGAVSELCRKSGLSVYHYQQLGFPSDSNFIVDLSERSWKAQIKSRLLTCLVDLGLMAFVRRSLLRFGYKRDIYLSGGNYNLFCVLVKGGLK